MQSVELTGVVDALPTPQAISGWVRGVDQTPVPGAVVTLHEAGTGRIIGQGVVSRFREDLGGICGFMLALDRPVTAAELQGGAVVARARLGEGAAWDLLVWHGLTAPPQPLLVDPAFLRHCRQQGFNLRPGGGRAYDDLALEAPCVLVGSSIGTRISLGAHSSVLSQVGGFINHTRVGRFCSIADHFTIAPDEHPTSFLSSSMLQYVPDVHGWDSLLAAAGTPRQTPLVPFNQRGLTIIGHDVWVGAHVFIRQGVRVGDGAILQAGAVVVADVPPYAVVGGVPARVIRQRFSDTLVERLLALRWWNYDVLAVAGLRFDQPADAVSLLEDKLAAGTLAPLAPARTSLAELHAAWTASPQPAPPPNPAGRAAPATARPPRQRRG